MYALVNSLLSVMSTRGHALVKHFCFSLIDYDIWILVSHLVLFLPLVGLELLKALLEDLGDVELVRGKFFVLEQNSLSFFLLTREPIPED